MLEEGEYKLEIGIEHIYEMEGCRGQSFTTVNCAHPINFFSSITSEAEEVYAKEKKIRVSKNM